MNVLFLGEHGKVCSGKDGVVRSPDGFQHLDDQIGVEQSVLGLADKFMFGKNRAEYGGLAAGNLTCPGEHVI